MEEKEKNKQILGKLYEIADNILHSLHLSPGVYTANELKKKAQKEGLFDNFECEGYEDSNEFVSITVDAFTCTFQLCAIFSYIVVFEKLAGMSAKGKQLFVIEPENNHYLSKVVVKISKKDLSLCNNVFCRKRNDSYFVDNEVICLDVPEREICATDGNSLEIRHLDVVDESEYNTGFTRPLVDAATWKKMCIKAGKGALLNCQLVNSAWICQCCDIVSVVYARQGLDYHRPFEPVHPYYYISMADNVWKEAKNWIKSNDFSFEDKISLIIEHSENDRFLKFSSKRIDGEEIAIAYFPCVETPKEYYYMSFNGETLAKSLAQFRMFLPKSATHGAVFFNSGSVQLRMPIKVVNMPHWSFESMNHYQNIFSLMVLDEKFSIIEPAKNHQVCVPKKSATPKTEKQEDKKTCKVVEILAKPLKVEGEKPSKVDRAFTFDKIGLSVGTIIQFIDGTDVTVAENNMIEFCGELFTLSGFTRTFIPSDKANKSGAYRGCAFFFYQGIRLDKLLKAALTSQEEECTKIEEECAKVEEECPKVEEVVTTSIHFESVKASCTETKREVKQIAAVIIHVLPCVISGTFIYPDTPHLVGGVPTVGYKDVWLIDTRLLLGRSKVIHELPLPPPGIKAA